MASEPDLVLYDGVCAMCNGIVRFLLARDRRDVFRFASIQSPVARALLIRHGCDPDALDTFYLVRAHGQPGERLLAKANGILAVLRALGGWWRVAGLLHALPAPLLEATYDFVARRRYRWFGKAERCALPDPRHAHRFLDRAP
jgi:predicted DCC family thiol-disulfide oxidoreductase YuxK